MRKLFPLLLAALLSSPTVGAAQEMKAWSPVTTVEPRLQVGTEYLFWWLREGRIGPTLTTGSAASRGILGEDGTRLLYGDDRLETRHGDQFNGLRLNLAYWFGDAQEIGFEANAFFLERDSTHFRVDSDGSTLLAIPYVRSNGSPASEIIAGQTLTGLRSGSFVGYSRIEFFGEEANLVALLLGGDGFRLEALGGARFLQMRDRTDLTSAGHSLPDQATLFGLDEHFWTHNAYYGGQLGLRGEIDFGRLSLKLCGEIGLGANAEQVRVFGEQIFQTPLVRNVTPTGLFVQASNRGTFERTSLNLVGEVSANVGYRLTQHFTAFGGYTFLLWDGALRSGDQIDPVINPHAGTVPARPAVPFREDTFWAQGLNVGLEFAW